MIWLGNDHHFCTTLTGPAVVVFAAAAIRRMANTTSYHQLSVRIELDGDPRHLLLIKRPVGFFVGWRQAASMLAPGMPITTLKNSLYSERGEYPGSLLEADGQERAMLVALAGFSKFSKAPTILSLPLLTATLRRAGRLTPTLKHDLAAPLANGVTHLVRYSPAAVLHNQQHAVVGLQLPAAPHAVAAQAAAAAAPPMLQPIIINMAPGAWVTLVA